MQVDAAVIYSLVAALTAAIVALYGVMLFDHKKCHTNLEKLAESNRILTEHTIAQQVDIRAFVDDRRFRGLSRLDLQSEKTEFYEMHVKPMEDI